MHADHNRCNPSQCAHSMVDACKPRFILCAIGRCHLSLANVAYPENICLGDVAYLWPMYVTLLMEHARTDAFWFSLMMHTLDNVACPKCISLGWYYLTLANANVAQPMNTHHDRCMQALASFAFHWPMSLAKYAHAMRDMCMPCLMLSIFGKCCLPKVHKPWLIVLAVWPMSMSPSWCIHAMSYVCIS